MSLNNRLNKLEKKATPKELPCAKIAIIDSEGSVKLSGHDIEPMTFPNEKALDVWADENGLNDPKHIALIKVNVMNAQGIPPEEL